MKTIYSSLLATLVCPAALSFAAISDVDLARLGKDLTPLGAERAGNADGSIPAWEGGVTAPPAGYKVGDHHPAPFPDEAPLYTITAANLSQYENRLTAGHVALLKTYPTYKIAVYPSHRTASYPDFIYEATRKVAPTAQLAHDGANVEGALVGIPFPVPQNGLEVIWNHLVRFRGVSAVRNYAQAAPLPDGTYSRVEFEDEFLFNYVRPGITEKDLNNILIYYKQSTIAPVRFAGSILLVHETMDQVKESRRAWIYNPGIRRVKLAPTVAYDEPGTAADGMRTNDQFDMYNGAPDRYEWKLVGKKEMIVPYNAYQLHSDKIKVADILKPHHINQDLARYELHRVWVVDATLKPGSKHLYPRRTFYIDEDSWQVLCVDQYNSRGQIWRVSEAHCMNYYEVPTFWSALEVHTDLSNGRYLAIGLNNEHKAYQFGVKRSPSDYSPTGLSREGLR
ncbi:MAG: DUF1329 domain-containing protein [Nibricoccus sp.]